MSSAGQIIGGVVGGIVGFFAGGNVMLGASIGMSIGGYIDPPKGPKVEGPRLTDTKQQTATYGAFIMREYGNIDAAGNVFWIENNALKEVSKTESQGGKGGGGGPEVTTYSYYGTFAIGLCECAIGEEKQLGRIWIRGKPYYDQISTPIPDDIDEAALLFDGLMSKMMASSESRGTFTFYSGAADQQPDDRMQATLGVDNVPAYRGLCYIVFKDLPLEDYGNSIVGTQVKIEILGSASDAGPELASTASYGALVYETGITRVGDQTTLASAVFANDTWDQCTVRTKIDHIIPGHFVSTEIDPLPQNLIFNNALPGKYPWLMAPLYLISGGVRYNGTDYPFGSYSTVYTKDWVVSRDGSLFFLYTDYLYKASSAGLLKTVEISADTMYLVNDTLYVFTTGTTYKFDTDLNLVSTLSNTLDMKWGSGDSYSWMAFGGNDGRIYMMEVYGVAQRTVAKLDPLMTSIEKTYDLDEVTGERGRGAIYVLNGVLIRAYINSDDEMTVEKWIIDTISPQTVPLSEIVSKECLSSGLLTADDIDVTALTQEVRGYKVSSVGSIRSALEPLQASWPFDVVQSGYKLKFVPRGLASVAAADSADLVPRGTDKAQVRIVHSREIDSQLPRRVEVTYFDYAREYDIGPAGIAERLNTDAINVEQVALPIVLTASEAAEKAQVLLYQRWLDRHEVLFGLPPSYLDLEPADVITITDGSATYICRLVEINYLPDGSLECQARFASYTVYTPVAVAQDGYSTGQPLTYAGPSEAVMLDIPCVLDDMDTAGFVVGMFGRSPSWNGGAVVRTDDGQTWTNIAAFSRPGSVVGVVSGNIGIGRVDIPDTSNLLVAYFSGGEITSVTEPSLAAGANMFAYGADQRWEIISARYVTDRSDGGKNLNTLYRGRFGTEWAMSLHQDGDLLVLLDLNEQQFISQNLNNIGQQRTYRAVGRGKDISAAADQLFTYRGMNLECLSPVYLNGSRNVTTLDWELTWVRRTRVGGEWRDLVDAPLGEPAENYVIEIWDDSSYTALKRTLTSTTQSTTYTNAQQVTDFGTPASTLYVKVFQVSATVGNGTPLVTSISRTIAPTEDYLWAYVASLLHFDGVNNGTTFTDQKGKTWSRSGSPVTSTTQSMFGGASGYFSGAQYIYTPNHADFNFGAGDFCIEWSTYYTTAPGSSGNPQRFLRKWTTASQQCFDLWMYYQGGGSTEFRFSISTTGSDSIVALSSYTNVDSWSVPVNSFARWALFRYGNMLYFTLNGVVKKSAAFTSTIFSGTSEVEFGNGDGSSAAVFYAEELRITKSGRYSGAYSPISEQFQNS